MDIAWIGHAAFRLRGRDAAVIMDPAPSSTGFRLNRPQADIVTVSNSDPGHSWLKGVGGNPICLDSPGEYEIKNVLVTGISDTQYEQIDETEHNESQGMVEIKTNTNKTKKTTSGMPHNVVFVVTIDNLSVAHLGNMQVLPTGETLEEIRRADILLIPVGGHTHMDAKTAADLVNTVAPKIVIPMLYQAGPETENLEAVDLFLSAAGGTMPKEIDNHINITQSSLPENTILHVLSPRGD